MGTAIILGRLGQSHALLPFFSFRVPAGFPSPALDHMEQVLSLDDLLDVRAPHTYLVQAAGDSMKGAGIFDGDILVVSRARAAMTGDIIIAALNGEVFVKRLSKRDGMLVLHSENPAYQPRFVMEGEQLEEWGVVIASLRRHDHG